MRGEKRRLAVLVAAIMPPQSAAARLAQLNADQSAAYYYWRQRLAEWHQVHDHGGSYQALLSGEAGPRLRSDVAAVLFGTPESITEDMSLGQIQQIYAQIALR